METLKALTQYYGSYDENSRLDSRRGQVEFLTTLRYIEKYLRPGRPLPLRTCIRLRPVARNSMPKILDPLPVIADANQLLRHSLHDQIVTLCYQFFLHMSRVFAYHLYA